MTRRRSQLSDLPDDHPRFSGRYVSEHFFGKSQNWLARTLQPHHITWLDGTPLDQPPRGGSIGRDFSLAQIRDLTVALWNRGFLKEDEMRYTIRTLLVTFDTLQRAIEEQRSNSDVHRAQSHPSQS